VRKKNDNGKAAIGAIVGKPFGTWIWIRENSVYNCERFTKIATKKRIDF
jgi:hypothetical protein